MYVFFSRYGCTEVCSEVFASWQELKQINHFLLLSHSTSASHVWWNPKMYCPQTNCKVKVHNEHKAFLKTFNVMSQPRGLLLYVFGVRFVLAHLIMKHIIYLHTLIFSLYLYTVLFSYVRLCATSWGLLLYVPLFFWPIWQPVKAGNGVILSSPPSVDFTPLFCLSYSTTNHRSCLALHSSRFQILDWWRGKKGCGG